jgi:hypothetical protein
MKDQLVSEYLEDVSREVLEKYQEIITEFTHRRRGIYALYSGSKLYYVGLATDLRQRLKTHLTDRHEPHWDRFSVYLTISRKHTKGLESLALRIFQPTGNRVKGKFFKADDLQGQFRQQVRDMLDKEFLRIAGSTKKVQSKEMAPKSKATGRRPTMSNVVHGKMKLRFRYKGITYWGTVRTDGTIKFKGKIYNSPSMACNHIIKRAVDGWHMWEFERAPGDWVKIDVLRK